jgi:hypothetical protein
MWLEIATAYASPVRSSGGLESIAGPDAADALESALGVKKGTLSNAVIAEKKKKRDRIRQL